VIYLRLALGSLEVLFYLIFISYFSFSGFT